MGVCNFCNIFLLPLMAHNSLQVLLIFVLLLFVDDEAGGPEDLDCH